MKAKRGRNFGQRIGKELAIWRVGAISGLLVIALISAARITGSLQFMEWFALDYMLRSRSAEQTDDRILVVGITEADIRQIGTYPVPDRTLAELLTQLLSHQPSAIGLDIFRDFAVPPGEDAFATLLQTQNRIFTIEKIVPDRNGDPVEPPPNLPPDRVGFVDQVPDADGFLRRNLLGSLDTSDTYKFSLTLRLAQTYLADRGLSLENGIRDPSAMRFGNRELTRFLPNTGGYVGTDAGGTQILLNPRAGEQPFRVVSLADVRAGRVPDEWIRDRVVLVGITALSARDVINSAAIQGSNPGLVYGVEYQAHAVSQILGAVLGDRSLLKTWTDGWEYVWIVGWGLIGISLGRFFASPLSILLGLGVASVVLLGSSYGLLLGGWWVPIVPAAIGLVLNGTGLTAALFYRQTQNLKARLQDRQAVIDQTFGAIHDGPLQRLAVLMRRVQSQDLSFEQVRSELEHLNRELREVYDTVRQEALNTNHFAYPDDAAFDLKNPLYEVLYEVYSNALMQDWPCFKTIKFVVPVFEELETQGMKIEQQRELCRFLEEALRNVGKYAVGVTRLEVVCRQEQRQNVIRVVDDGIGLDASELSKQIHLAGGWGTRHANHLARQLGGRFRRSPNSPRGTICQLSWPATKPRFWR